jgi:hypothetical protein
MLYIPPSSLDGEIHTSDGVSLVDIEPDLNVLQEYLDGGWLESVTLHTPSDVPEALRPNTVDCHVYVDEEGLLKHLPLNIRATMLMQQYTWFGVLAGPAVFLGHTDEGAEADVPSEVVAKAQTLGFLA